LKEAWSSKLGRIRSEESSNQQFLVLNLSRGLMLWRDGIEFARLLAQPRKLHKREGLFSFFSDPNHVKIQKIATIANYSELFMKGAMRLNNIYELSTC
jgi:hypothetical protein